MSRLHCAAQLTLTCIVLLAGCAYSSPTPFPKSTVTPGTDISINQPSPVIDQSSGVTLEPTRPHAYQTISPEIASTISPAVQLPSYQVPAQYQLEAVFDYYQHFMTVSEFISYTNYTTVELTDLLIMVEPNRWKGGFLVSSITWENGDNVESYKLMDDQMYIPLPRPLLPGERLGLRIEYQLDIPMINDASSTARPLPYGYSERQTNIVDWYPYIPPYRVGEGWLVHRHWGFGEHQVFDVADFRVSITLSEPVSSLVIAASAPATQYANSYSYRLDAARTFALSASTEYLVQSASIDGITVYSYSFPYDKNAGNAALHSTAEALQLYSRLITPYMHSSLSVVEADFLDGMEYEGLYFMSHGFYDLYDGTPKGYLTLISAHETAHQWWYGLVGNDQALEPWLDEALCTYMERIFYENIYADYPPGSGESLVDWWWLYRVNFYEPGGFVNSTIYDYNQFLPYRNAIYLVGAGFLEDLRKLVGDQAFFAFLRGYAIQESHRIATSADFFSILKEYTAQDLNGLLTRYFQDSK